MTQAGRLALALLICTVLASCGGDDASNPSPMTVASGVHLVQGPRTVAAPDGSRWLAWSQAVDASEAIVAARVDRVGKITTAVVSPAPAEFSRDAQVMIAGTTPVLAWWEFDTQGHRIRVMSWNGQRWVMEQTLDASTADLVMLRLRSDQADGLALVWSEFQASGETRMFSKRRSAAGDWSAAHLISSLPAGTLLPAGFPDTAFRPDGSAMTIWAEEVAAPTTLAQPQTLWTARFDPVSNGWGPAAQIAAGDRYVPTIASTPNADGWLAAWIARPPISGAEIATVQASRFVGGSWEDPVRVDTSDDEIPRELVLDGNGPAARLAWSTHLQPDAFEFGIRSAVVDATGRWSDPTLLFRSTSVLPAGLRLHQQGDGSAALVWGAATGAAPWVALCRPSGSWAEASLLESNDVAGNAPDVAASFPGWSLAWYRWRSGGVQDLMLLDMR